MIPVYSPATVRMGRISPSHNRLLAMTLFGMVLVSVCSGQVAIPTSRTDNTRISRPRFHRCERTNGRGPDIRYDLSLR